MLDTDMLIRSNIDDLFSLDAPAAMRRHGGTSQPAHGESFFAADIWKGPFVSGGIQNRGINAGVMLLEPNEEIYERMCREVAVDHVEHVGTYGPEQDYISRFYTTFGDGGIRHIACEYNYQPSLQDDYTSSHFKALGIDDVKVCHFSGGVSKPWNLDIATLLRRDDAIKATYRLQEPRSGTMWSDYTWEWVFAAREAADDVEQKTGKSLESHIITHTDKVDSELKRMNQREPLLPEDQRMLEDALGEWPRKWRTFANGRHGWLEFRPHSVLWTDKGIATWRQADDRIFLGGHLNVLVKMVPPGENDKTSKKFAGSRIQGWPTEEGDTTEKAHPQIRTRVAEVRKLPRKAKFALILLTLIALLIRRRIRS